jgi:hypothetical protein
MKYIYSPQHQGLVLAPLMTEPNILADEFHNENGLFKKSKYNKHKGAYNTWLSSPPAYKVRPEDIEWFSVERGENEFETLVEFLSHDEKTWMVNIVFTKQELRYAGRPFRTVAIPKKGNESKEQSPSIDLDQVVYVPTSVKDETPPFNESVVCLSDGDNLGWFSFPGINSWHVAIDDHTITHWLKKTTIRELIHQPYK